MLWVNEMSDQTYKLAVAYQKTRDIAERLIAVAERMGACELDLARMRKKLADIEKENAGDV